MIDWLEGIDRALFLFLNGCHTSFFDTVMWYVSTIIVWIPLFIYFTFYAFKKGKWPFLIITLVGIALCILFADRISVEAFKEVFQRYRPTHNLEIKDIVHTVNKPSGAAYFGGMYGFVSSHAANFFAITTFLVACFFKFSKKWFFLFLWATLIGYSRIYLGVHYPADVFVGGILGISIGYIVYLISKPIQKKYGIIKS
ncbi:MAG: phosphatase PAP2 family protein [Crocinitomicaceae bacterium]